MNASGFKTSLQSAKPDVDTLLNIGLDADAIAEIIASFEIHEKAVHIEPNLPDSVLNDLFARYDASAVEIGMVRLLGAPKRLPSGWVIGNVEADHLVLDPVSGEIMVKDLAAANHTIWKCAGDGAKLLAALAQAAEYLGKCFLEDQSGSQFQRSTIDRCTTLAGGATYDQFYEMLLGGEK